MLSHDFQDQRPTADISTINPILPFKILRLPEVLAMVGIGKTALYQRINNGTFPAPIKIGVGRASGWVQAEIIQWLAEQIQHRNFDACNAAKEGR
jgi:prophage regulatory protein